MIESLTWKKSRISFPISNQLVKPNEFLPRALNKASPTRLYAAMIGVRETIRRWFQELIDDGNEKKFVGPMALARCSREGKTCLEGNSRYE
jgi:hypothetical protein